MLKKIKNRYNIYLVVKINIEENKMKSFSSKKIIIILILAILFIVIFSLLGIQAAKAYNKKLINKKQTSQIKIIEDVQENTNVSLEETAKENKIKLPVYSEEAKEKMKNIYKSDEKIAYLTFDDGPSQAVTPLILDLLKKENIKATFFVLGKRVKANPELVKREYEEGHYVANHGYTHEYDKIYKSVDNVLNEYNETEKEIRNAIKIEDYSSYLFRFPGGNAGGKYANIKSNAGKVLNENNISYIDWNALNSDAAGANTKEKLISNIKDTTKDKNVVIILMHDAADKILTYETLSDVINYLRNEGYRFDNFYSIMK